MRWLHDGFDALHSPGGQLLALFLLWYSTYAVAFYHIPETDLQKQAFAAVLAYMTGRASADRK